MRARPRAAGRLGQRLPGRLGRGQPGCEELAHPADAEDVVRGVEAIAGRGADRREQAVAALPGAQQLRRDARAPRELADSQLAVSFMTTVYRLWTKI